MKKRPGSVITYRRICLLLSAAALGFVFVFSGCGPVPGAPNADTGDNPPSFETEGPISSPADNTGFEAYAGVLRGELEFYSTDTRQRVFLNDFLADNGVYEISLQAENFAVLDMDGDNSPEAVLELTASGLPEFYEIFHYMDGEVYGYLIAYRGLRDLRSDGTFCFSSGAADYGWGRLDFQRSGVSTKMLGYSRSNQEDGNLTVSYYIDNEAVTKETFDSAMDEQSAKSEAVWFVYAP